ncbi:hypothetical protein BTUL_0071g00450 [Botrytis tulipae]|uniref:Uncharacterized protein n=1 Tax=Botrytis tulipae TaxID=87230 RepID=A0A4Z1EX31_9HELO|nr:hypothetical protein BTUL_0071g00450 [Botrytis tulipae]
MPVQMLDEHTTVHATDEAFNLHIQSIKAHIADGKREWDLECNLYKYTKTKDTILERYFNGIGDRKLFFFRDQVASCLKNEADSSFISANNVDDRERLITAIVGWENSASIEAVSTSIRDGGHFNIQMFYNQGRKIQSRMYKKYFARVRAAMFFIISSPDFNSLGPIGRADAAQRMVSWEKFCLTKENVIFLNYDYKDIYDFAAIYSIKEADWEQNGGEDARRTFENFLFEQSKFALELCYCFLGDIELPKDSKSKINERENRAYMYSLWGDLKSCVLEEAGTKASISNLPLINPAIETTTKKRKRENVEIIKGKRRGTLEALKESNTRNDVAVKSQGKCDGAVLN